MSCFICPGAPKKVPANMEFTGMPLSLEGVFDNIMVITVPSTPVAYNGCVVPGAPVSKRKSGISAADKGTVRRKLF
jgi:hypothetical protein